MTAPKARICVATPLYGDPEAAGLSKAFAGTMYAFGSDLSVLCGDSGWDSGDIELDFSSPYPNSIEHARNNLVRLFLEHPRGYSHLLFWDSDEQAPPNTIAKLIMRLLRANYPIGSVPSVEKSYHWEKAARALQALGLSSESLLEIPEEKLGEILRGAACRYLPDPLRSICKIAPAAGGSGANDDFREMAEGYVSLGFALVRRDVLEHMSAVYKDSLGYTMHDHEDRPIRCVGLFHTTCEGGRLAMEDMAFCDRARACGFGQYLYLGEGAPIHHAGRHVFKGTREAMLRDWSLDPRKTGGLRPADPIK